MGVFTSDTGHEQVVFCQDKPTGLRAIIGIYSTALGPALGGTRFYPYASEEAALHDVLELSRGMAYKNALAGLDLGGGKAVIWGDPEKIKSEGLLRAYGRMVESLGGRYYTACDVGTYVQDMDVIARETRFVTGRSVEHGGAGDSSILTAWGVFQGMRAAAEHVYGTPSLAGRRVGIAGLGKVGKYLTTHLLDDGASVVATDVSEKALAWAKETYPQVDIVDDAAELIAVRHRRVRAVRPRRRAERRHRAGAPGEDRRRRREQPAGPPGHREAAGGPRHPVRTRLRRQRRRRDPGGRRDRGLQLRARQAAGHQDLRHHASSCCSSRPPRACRRRSRRTGWPSAGWPRSDGCGPSGCNGRSQQPVVSSANPARCRSARRTKRKYAAIWRFRVGSRTGKGQMAVGRGVESGPRHVPYEPREMPNVIGARLVWAAP